MKPDSLFLSLLIGIGALLVGCESPPRDCQHYIKVVRDNDGCCDSSGTVISVKPLHEPPPHWPRHEHIIIETPGYFPPSYPYLRYYPPYNYYEYENNSHTYYHYNY